MDIFYIAVTAVGHMDQDFDDMRGGVFAYDANFQGIGLIQKLLVF
jgi:hypothetical protein